MSYFITYKGVTIKTRSLTEAVSITKMLTDENSPESKNGNQPTAPITPSSIQSFWGDTELAKEGRSILMALRNSENGLATDELAKATNIEPENIKYVIRGVYAVARKHRINGKLLIYSKRIYVDRAPKSIYKMKAKMRKAIENVS